MWSCKNLRVRRTYSYTEALKILGGAGDPAIAAMDKLLGGALLLGSAGMWEVLDLFDAKPDFTRWSNDLVGKALEKRRGLTRHTRTQRLHAAHAVVVLTAFFEAVQEADLGCRLTPEDQDVVMSYNPWQMALPLPSAGQSYDENLGHVRRLYDELGSRLSGVLANLAFYDGLNDTEKDRLTRLLAGPVPERAVERYEELFRQLAVDCPEIGFWYCLEDGRASRAALARVEDALRGTTTDLVPEVRLAELAGVYRDVLTRPLVKSADVPAGLTIPALTDAYVDPRFQVAVWPERVNALSLLSSWDDVSVRADLYAYLAGYLTSPDALCAPLLVLGDPGSGKSLLTEMLAARLPASDFAVVRVELRNTPADADLVRQIEHGLHRLLDEPVSWADFSRNTGGALPVVMLDGFDELLQATGVSQTRYLEVVAEFQQKLLAKGRPAAFVVTSRLSVSAGLALPLDTHVVRLLPFDDDQVRRWLAVWNAANAPLPVDVVLGYPELASQPLLLLMLALYDAVDSSLQRDHESISQAELYERLLTRFARREVTKDDADRAPADLDEDVEVELDRLSVVALGMFNRGTQWVSDEQVSKDLRALLEVESPDRTSGARTPLSSGETVLGRFFFVQKSEAVREDNTRLRTYEFLHATFGEYLVARYVWRALEDLAREDAARSRRKSGVDDTELFQLLSYAPLTSSKPVLDFLREFAAASAKERLFDLVVRLFEARDARRSSWGGYEPVSLPDSARQAKYSLNLVVLALVLRKTVRAADLRMKLHEWRQTALFWKSRLSPSEWMSVLLRFWMVHNVEMDFVLSLSERMRGALGRELMLSEAYLTLDEASLTLRNAIGPLLAQHPVEVVAALIDLAATPVRDCVRSLQNLARSGAPNDLVDAELLSRLGRGGDDLAILGTSAGTAVEDIDTETFVDAWLRLYEGGFRFGQYNFRLIEDVLLSAELHRAVEKRPDLLTRARRAAAELGLELEL